MRRVGGLSYSTTKGVLYALNLGTLCVRVRCVRVPGDLGITICT